MVLGTFYELSGIDAEHMVRQFAEGVKGIINLEPGNQAQFISEFSTKIKRDKSPLIFRIKIEEITGKKREV